jgi:hypothetical protein
VPKAEIQQRVAWVSELLQIGGNALTEPELFLFAYAGGTEWMCELTSRCISVTERVAARLADNR